MILVGLIGICKILYDNRKVMNAVIFDDFYGLGYKIIDIYTKEDDE